jgi:hypothetical protein
MTAATSRAAASSDVEIEQVVGRFRAALDELTSAESVWPVVDRVRTLKGELGPNLLVPEILEASIAYNLAVWNRRQLITRANRVVEDAECIAIEEPRGEEPEASIPGRSLLEHPGIQAVVAALRDHLIGRPPASGLASEIAVAVQRSSFTAFEASVLRDAGDDPAHQAVRAAVAVGLIARAIPTRGDRLAELEIDPDEVEGAWKAEADGAIQRVVQRCVADERHVDARRFAEVRTKYLHGAPDRETGFRSARSGGPTPTGSRARARSATPASRAQSGARQRDARGHSRELAKAAVGALLLAVALAIYLLPDSESNIVVFSAADLAAVSPWLETGYRNRDGIGPLFIGTLKEGWLDEPDRVRAASGREIGESLSHIGVKQVMLFDGLRRLQVHYRNDEARLPARGR